MLDRLRSTDSTQRLCWLAAVVWIAQPFLLGPLLSESWASATDLFRTVATWGSWLVWLAILICLITYLPVTLTLARVGVAATIPAALWATIETDDTALATLGLLGAVAATFTILMPGVADRFVDGASYGDERRFVLRPQGPVLLLVMIPTWAVVVAGVTTGPLLLADERWISGAIATAVGLVLATAGFRALLRLTSRFVVFVPNGVVLHDRGVLREPVLFGRSQIIGIGPASAKTTATDLTAAALGLALEIKLANATRLPLVTGRADTEERDVESLLIAPSRPAAVMRLAQERGIRIA